MAITWPRDALGNEYCYLGEPPVKPTYQYMVVDEKIMEIKEIIVHKFSMGDVEDPDLYAAEPLYEWQQSEQGQWVMKHAVETPMWRRFGDPYTFGHTYVILAKLTDKHLTEFYLRFDKPQK